MKAAWVAVLACACSEPRRAAPDAAPVVLAAEPVPVDLGAPIFENPLNLYDLWIPGATRYDRIGTLDGADITTMDIDADAGGALTELGKEIYRAREAGYRWIVERSALARVAGGRPVMELLREEAARLPAPTAEQLAAIDPEGALAELPPSERDAARLTLWRLRAWEIRRSQLVADGMRGMEHGRITANITRERWTDPDEVEAVVDGRPLSRVEMRRLAGFGAELLRDEYWRIMMMHVDRWIDRRLAPEPVIAAEVAKLGAITDDEVRAYVAANPEYATDPQGFERARDQVRRLRRAQVERELPARLRASAAIVIDVRKPDSPRWDVDVPAPRRYGLPPAPHRLVVYHAVGCEDCRRGSRLLRDLIDAYRGRVEVIAGDWFRRGSLVGYRGALALHCAEAQGVAEAYLRRVIEVERPVELSALRAIAGEVAADADAFERCVRDDRYLADVIENLEVAERLGLEPDIPGLFLDGVRLGDLGDIARVQSQIDQQLD